MSFQLFFGFEIQCWIDYLSVVCIGFYPPSDVLWWKNVKASVLPFETTEFSDVTLGELTSTVRKSLSVRRPSSAALI
jgi:hypothetical protein